MPPLTNVVTIEDLYRLAPVLVAAAFGILVMVVDRFVPERAKYLVGRLAVLGGLAALFSVTISARHRGYSYPDDGAYALISVDYFSVFLFLAIFTFTVLALLGSLDYLERERLQH